MLRVRRAQPKRIYWPACCEVGELNAVRDEAHLLALLLI